MAYVDENLNNPALFFNTVLWTGNGSNRDITGVGFEPNLTWIKQRNGTFSHVVGNSISGDNKFTNTSGTSAESTDSDKFRTFVSDGFQVGTHNGVNGTSKTYVAWCWKESNSDAGMDIVTWTGNGSSQNISHSLSAVPHFMITKNLSASGDWTTYHKFGGGTKTFYLSNTDAIGTTSSPWNNTDPTSSVFSVGAGAYTNGSGNSIIGYLWTEKQGFSKFGSYTGNGNADGTFVFCGFRPAFLLVKKSSASGSDWNLHNNKSPGFNVNDNYLAPNENAAEVTDNTYQIFDFTAQGFKCRGTGTGTNASGETMIYAAFAEAPFVNSNGVPCNAR